MARKPDDWMPLRIGLYLADTTHLTRDQHGAYLLLLMGYWMRGGALPADDRQLATISKCTLPEWRRMRPTIVAFFVERDGKWFQKRAEEELAKARSFVDAKSHAGRMGAEKRWQSDSKADGKRMAEASDSHRQTDAPLPSPSPTQDSSRCSESKTRVALLAEEELPAALDRRPKPPPFEIPGWVPKPEWDDFLDMRKRIRKPPTERAKGLLVDELQRLRDDGHDPMLILKNSTRNNWQDLYEPRETRTANGRSEKPTAHESLQRGTVLALERIAQRQ